MGLDLASWGHITQAHLALCTYWTMQERKTGPLPLLSADITSPACSTRSSQEPGLVHYG